MTSAGDIVVGVDGSEHAERALRWAAEQAALEGRPLLVVAAGRDEEAVAEQAADRALAVQPGIRVGATASAQDPREVLLELSERASMIVLGSRGRGAVRSMLLGSVSAAVSTHADCPVVVCRPRADVDDMPGVLVGLDGTREGLAVVDFAFRQAALRGLGLTVLHCFWDAAAAVASYRQRRGLPFQDPDLDELRVTVAESVAGFAQTYPDVHVTTRLEHGLVDEVLAPRGQVWDLVVVGRHPVTSVSRVITGSIAVAVLERARSTVAVVPEELAAP